ncbi:hypothetical protein WR25_14364 isoform B [Diploscapter pachys]|uniref:Transmembrane protein 144 n=1 Tax=Diploscapter pachys TaxID=2018661 RepID=A0A2A2J3A8_9BILA|nr:hypothetical protein WR25_14364 isoform B [Diploscapter pachys]
MSSAMSNLTSPLNSTQLPSTSLFTTLSPSHSVGDDVFAYGSLFVSCVAFGIMFIPLKNYDWLFVQWVECSIVFLAGFLINCIRGFPEFQWIAAIGGALYATGNVFSVPIIKGLGMGLGFLLWSSVQVIVGWGVARFGLFSWLPPTVPQHAILNYTGLALTIVSGILFVFVRHQEVPSKRVTSYTVNQSSVSEEKEDDSLTRDILYKIPFVIMAIGLAICHGLMMTPIQVLKEKHPTNDKWKVFDYHFSFYSTVFVFSTIYFLIYCVIRQTRAHVERELVIPAALYGVLWTIGSFTIFVLID